MKFDHQSGRHIKVNGAEIYCEEIGDSSKPVLVMLHGGFGDIEDLNPLASVLAADFRIIGLDSRGHGKSTLGNGILTYAQLQADVEEALQVLGIGTCRLFGFSDGGIVSYRIAASGNIFIERLVALGASWSMDDVVEAEEALKEITPETAREVFADNHERYQRINPEPEFDAFAGAVLGMWLDMGETGHPGKSVDFIKASTLLIRGDDDFLVSLESLAELKGRIPNASFMNIPCAAHAVHAEQPELLSLAVCQFFQELTCGELFLKGIRDKSLLLFSPPDIFSFSLSIFSTKRPSL